LYASEAAATAAGHAGGYDAVQARDEGDAPLTDSFNYTATDGDASSVASTLTISIFGANDAATISVNATSDTVYEAGLPAGSGTGPGTSISATGTFTIADTDGEDDIKSVTIAGQTFTVADYANFAAFTSAVIAAAPTAIAGGYGTVDITGYSNGTFNYTYTLTNAYDGNGLGAGYNTVTDADSFVVSVSDGTAPAAAATVNIDIVDDIAHITSVQNMTAQNTANSFVGNWVFEAGADGFDASSALPNVNSGEGINILLNNPPALVKASATEDKFDVNGNYLGELYTAYLDAGKTQTFFTLFMKTDGTYEFNLVTPNPTTTTSSSYDVTGSIGGLSGDLYLEQITAAKSLPDPTTDIKFTAHYGYDGTSLGSASNVNTSNNGLGVSTSGDGGGGLFVKLNESMTLTFYKGDADISGATHPTLIQGVDTVGLKFSVQTDNSGDTTADVKFVMHYADGTTGIFVYDGEISNNETVIVSGTKKILSVDVINVDNSGDTFLLTGTTTTVTTTTLPSDLSLNFSANIVDGDGDISNTASFTISIDTNHDLISTSANDILFGDFAQTSVDTFNWLAGQTGTDNVANFDKGFGGDVLNLADLLQGENSGNIEAGGFLTSATYASGNTTLVFDTNGSTAGGANQTIVIEGVDLTNGNSYSTSQVLHQLLLDGNIKIDS
jgi:VCBS repeat-containing protein